MIRILPVTCSRAEAARMEQEINGPTCSELPPGCDVLDEWWQGYTSGGPCAPLDVDAAAT